MWCCRSIAPRVAVVVGARAPSVRAVGVRLASTKTTAGDGVQRQSSSHRALNFSAGPACMPDEVMHRAAAEFTNWNGTLLCARALGYRDRDR